MSGVLEQGSPFGLVYLAVDEPKGDPSPGRVGTQLAETDLHVRPYGERHVRSYADKREILQDRSCWPDTATCRHEVFRQLASYNTKRRHSRCRIPAPRPTKGPWT